MAKVFNFKVYDITKGSYVIQPEKSTAERIKRANGEIIHETAEEVDDGLVVDDGKYDPPKDTE